MCDNSQGFMNTSDDPTDTLPRSTEMLQVDTLAPYLFMMVTDYNLQKLTDLIKK